MRVMSLFSWVGKIITNMWSPASLDAPVNSYDINMDDDEDDNVGGSSDPYIWYNDLKKHAFGEFSYAVVQANEELLDYSQVEIGQTETFLGVYAGHGGSEASSYLCDNFFPTLIDRALEDGSMLCEGTLKKVTWITAGEYRKFVARTYEKNPQITKVGSCCLVGVISRNRLFVSNVGDSRAVIGKVITRGLSDEVVADQITKHNKTLREEIRRQLKIEHRGGLEVPKTVWQANSERAEFAMGSDSPFFYQLHKPVVRPIMRYPTEGCARFLCANDKFVVFASDGFWEHITNQQAVEIVHNNPKSGIARRLLKSAMTEAANKMHKKYKDLRDIDKGFRRCVHKDMTVIVVFIDYELVENWYINPSLCEADQVSSKCFSNLTHPSMFRKLPEYPFLIKT